MLPNALLFLGAVGLTIIVAKSRILASVRQRLLESKCTDVVLLGELLSCSMCTGAWMGFGVGVLLGYGPVEILACGGVVSLLSWFAWGVGCALELLGEKLKERK